MSLSGRLMRCSHLAHGAASRRIGLALLATIICFSAAPVSGQRISNSDYVAGRDAWNAQNWLVASNHLSRFWLASKATATYEVDFWLGTSWCRMVGKEAPGADLLDWALSFNQMPEGARPAFASELKRCVEWIAAATEARAAPPTLTFQESGRSTVIATGKTYAVGGGDGSLVAYPVRARRHLPPEDFDARLVSLDDPTRAVALTKQRAGSLRVSRSHYFVLASASPSHTDAMLEDMGARLDEYVAFLVKMYSLEPPDTFITVYMFPDVPMLRSWADTLHGLDASPATLGYSFDNDKSILALVSSANIGTLLHETFHIVVRDSYASIPQWLDEGIASLYETSTAAGGSYFGEPNWRSPVFKELRFAFPNLNLRFLVTAPWFSDEPSVHTALHESVLSSDEQAYVLAYARLFALYLQERGVLVSVFSAFRNRVPPPEYVPAKVQAVTLFETALKSPVERVEQDFQNWVPRVLDPNVRLHQGQMIRKELPGGR